MLVPHDIERELRRESDPSVAAKAASCFLAVSDSIIEVMSDVEFEQVIEALAAIAKRPSPRLLDTAELYRDEAKKLAYGGSRNVDRLRVVQIASLLYYVAATFDRKSAIDLCVRCADYAQTMGESGDLAWVKAAWAETAG